MNPGARRRRFGSRTIETIRWSHCGKSPIVVKAARRVEGIVVNGKLTVCLARNDAVDWTARDETSLGARTSGCTRNLN